jgi:DNA gyrase/topoisomerase IV subunit A
MGWLTMITERERLHNHILKLSRLVDEKDNVIKNLRKELAQYKKDYANRNTWAEYEENNV